MVPIFGGCLGSRYPPEIKKEEAAHKDSSSCEESCATSAHSWSEGLRPVPPQLWHTIDAEPVPPHPEQTITSLKNTPDVLCPVPLQGAHDPETRPSPLHTGQSLVGSTSTALPVRLPHDARKIDNMNRRVYAIFIE